jgi:hypothetical protein
MIAPIHPEPEENGADAACSGQGFDPSNGAGGLFSNPNELKADVKLVKRSIAQRWTIRNGMRKEACERLRRMIAADHLEPDQHVAAIKALGYLDSLNIKREHGPPQGGGGNTVNVLNVSIESLLSAPGYVNYLESRDDRDSGTVCPDSDAGEVLPAPTHPGNINGHNGNHHGKN